MNRNKLKKVHYIGKKYKIVEITLNGQLMYLVANADEKGVYTAFDNLEKAKELWRKMEKEL
jgi:ribosome-associated translation inhibitor RaiA